MSFWHIVPSWYLVTASDFAHPLMKVGRPSQPLRTTLTESVRLTGSRSVRPPLVALLDGLRLCSDWFPEITAVSQPRSWYLLAASDFMLWPTVSTWCRTITDSVPTVSHSARPATSSAATGTMSLRQSHTPLMVSAGSLSLRAPPYENRPTVSDFVHDPHEFCPAVQTRRTAAARASPALLPTQVHGGL